jgi:hypothetical protein
MVQGGTADKAFGQYMLGQLNSLADFAKVDAPLHTKFNLKGDKGPAKKGAPAAGKTGVRIVDAAGMAADGEEGDGVV